VSRLLRWFLAHDPTTACTWDNAAEVAAENARLKARVRELELEVYMRDHAADQLAGMEDS
jgi:hypothetical protein